MPLIRVSSCCLISMVFFSRSEAIFELSFPLLNFFMLLDEIFLIFNFQFEIFQCSFKNLLILCCFFIVEFTLPIMKTEFTLYWVSALAWRQVSTFLSACLLHMLSTTLFPMTEFKIKTNTCAVAIVLHWLFRYSLR